MKKPILILVILFITELSTNAAVSNFTNHDLTGTIATTTTQVTAKGFELSWTHEIESDLHSYKVYYSIETPGNFISYGTIIHPIKMWICDLDLIRYETYYWVVTALDLTGNESSPSEMIAVEIINAKPKFNNAVFHL